MQESQAFQRESIIRTLHGLPPSRSVFTKSQLAYADVRRAIVTHSLPDNVPLDEAQLLATFPVGRTPLREALKRLSHEGLLNWPAHQAPSIRDVAVHEMLYLYESRRILEPVIAILAARRATHEDHQHLIERRDELQQASESGDVYSSVEQDYAFHKEVAAATHNRFLADASNQLNLQSLRLWYRNQKTHGVETVHRMHSDLMDAIVSHDEELSRQLALQHIEASLNRQRAMLAEPDSIPID